mgnify:CR=1 FL=1
MGYKHDDLPSWFDGNIMHIHQPEQKKIHNALQPATEIHKGAPDLINGHASYPDFYYHLWYKNCASTASLSASNSEYGVLLL